MYARPKPSETDEDLLRLQEEFDRDHAENKVKLAATVIKEKRAEPSTSTAEIEDQLANTFEAIPNHSNLGRIVENAPGNVPHTALHFSKKEGFPVAKRREITQEGSSRGSIFAQQFKKLKRETNLPQPSLPDESFVVSGNDKDGIHEENIAKMKSMTQEEILEERERLIATMDPAIIAYLKSRRQKGEVKSGNRTIQEQNAAGEDIDVASIETTREILEQPQADRWLNFSEVEATKLAWMTDAEVPKISRKHSYEARFDFEGWLLPYAQEITEESRALYHHGDEAGRPGYTLQELFQLSRSTIVQQKIVALNTIANILELQSTGVYDDVIELPIEQIFFVLRFCLDDNTPGVLNAAIKAMRNLFFSKVDEICLDCLLGFGLGSVQPILSVDDETEDDDRINDQQLAETNLVKCLARTEIFTRIRYIINTVKPGVESIVYCLDLLTRLARDSQFILNKIVKCENLLSSIVANFMPQNGLPLAQAVKLIRIMASRSRQICEDLLLKKHQIMDSIITYLSEDNYSRNANGLKLQIECLHLWAVLLHFGLAQDYFTILTPVLVEMLRYHLNTTNLNMSTSYVRVGHVAALLILLSAAKNQFFLAPFANLLHKCVIKWFKQFMVLSEFACGKLQTVAALFQCLTSCNGLPGEIETLLTEVILSEGFNLVSGTLRNSSMLLNDYATHNTSANLRGVEAAAWYCSEHVIPIVQTNSPLLFLSSFSNFLVTIDDKNLKLTFLRHKAISSYFEILRSLDKYHLSSHWFTRIETNFIMNVLKMAVAVKAELDTRPFFEVAVKCLSIFTADQKPSIEYILKFIVLSREFYPSDVLLRKLSIEQNSSSYETSLENLDEIFDVYVRILGLKIEIPTFEDSLSLDLKRGTVIPIDWIYTPIVVLYSNQQQNKCNPTESEQVYVIRNCLRWILIYETYFPELAACINTTDRFCHIACVFLGSDNLFLIEEIHSLLQLCLVNVMKCSNEINFDKEIQGLSSFQDFYTQLLEQYQAVSYGDVLFGNFVLVPLAQRHSPKWRKALWSEYLGVVEIFNVTVEQSVTPLDCFLQPDEEDLSLLKCYHRALTSNSVRKHSILYHIAKHHVEQYVANKRK